MFPLLFAWRDSRTARRRLFLSSTAIMLGVAALVAIGSLADNLRRAVDRQARSLLGADLAVTSRSGWSPEIDAALDHLAARVPGSEQAREAMFSSMVTFPQSGGQTRLATIRAFEGAYPFYGDIVTEPATPAAGASSLLADGRSALVEKTLLVQFGAKVGDPIRLGRKTYAIAGALDQIPGETMSVATLSPRVVVALSSLPETGLLGFGSLVRHRAFFRFPPGTDVDALARAERPRLEELRLRLQTVSGRQEQLGRSIENIHAFLSLTGFISLFLGAIGVASAIHVHIRQKLATVAILRCLGASSRQCFAAYLAQGLALGVFGAGLGAALGVAVQLALPTTLHAMLPVDVEFFVSWPAVARGFLAGLGICFLFTLLPLLAVRRVPPLRALRAAFEPPAPQFDPLRWSVYGLIVAAVFGFALWQTGRWTHALGFVGGLLAGLGVLAGIARLLMLAARRAVRLLPGIAGGYAWRQGISNLYRPNNRTLLLLLSLGLGTCLLLTLGLARSTLVAQLSGSDGRDRPNLMLFDIQEDQVAPLTEILRGQGAEIRDSAPIVTMQLASIKGVPVADVLRDPGNDIPRWALRREYRSTYRGALAASEKQVAGEFTGRFAGNAGGEDIIPISLETGLAKDMHLGLGDELVFDVQGVPMRTRITSLREVEWRQLSPNFFVVFPEGVLEGAPQFHVMAVRTATAADSARVQQAVTQALPNVSAIDLAMVMQTLDSIFSKVEAVVQFIAFFTLGTGIIVLAGAVLTSRSQRIREIVLLRTLGASGAQLMRIQIAEYAALGLFGALTGAALAMAANVALARFVFAAPPAFPAGLLAGAVAGVAALAVLTGLLSGRGLTRQPPLAVLRQEE